MLNERWRRLCILRYAEFNVPTGGNIAVRCSLCVQRKTKPFPDSILLPPRLSSSLLVVAGFDHFGPSCYLYLLLILHERWRRLRYAEFNVPTRGKIAVSQLCRERQNLFRTASLFSTKVIFADLPRKAFPR